MYHQFALSDSLIDLITFGNHSIVRMDHKKSFIFVSWYSVRINGVIKCAIRRTPHVFFLVKAINVPIFLPLLDLSELAMLCVLLVIISLKLI